MSTVRAKDRVSKAVLALLLWMQGHCYGELHHWTLYISEQSDEVSFAEQTLIMPLGMAIIIRLLPGDVEKGGVFIFRHLFWLVSSVKEA